MPETKVRSKISLNENTKDKSNIVRLIGCALTGFSLSQLDSLGDISPFSSAFVAGVPFDYCFSSFIGSAVGYFFSRKWMQALRYLFSLLVVVLFRLLAKRKFETSDKPFVCAFVSFAALLCSGGVYFVFSQYSISSVLLLICEGALSFVSVILFKKVQDVPVFSIGLKRLSAQDAVCLSLNLCVLLMCLSGLTIGNISPARIAASMLVIFAAQYKGIMCSSVFGICAGLSLCITPSFHFLFAVYALGGLVSGLFSPLGQYVTSLSYAVTASVITLICGIGDLHFFPIAEAVIAAAAYAVIPMSKITNLQQSIDRSGLIRDEEVERRVCAELDKAAEKVGEVSTIVTRVSERLDRIINPEINGIFAKMQQNVCYGCGKKSECWNKYFNETASDIMTIAGFQTGSKSKTSLESRCIRPNALMDEIDNYYDDFVSSVAAKMKVSEMRSIVSDQFSGLSQFLSEIASQMRNSRVADRPKARSIKIALSDSCIFTDSLSYFTNSDGKVTVEASFFDTSVQPNIKAMKSVIEFVTSRRFEQAEIAITDTRKIVIFEERANYRILVGHSQIPYAKNKVSGDCFGRAKDFSGNEVVLISDGMGTGSRAAIDANMTTALMEKLLSCGFSFDCALKTVCGALIVKSTDESLATVDGLSFNIYSGVATFHKAGAANSFIRRDRDVTVVEEPSMPIGIIRSICTAERDVELDEGDIVLLVSDGVTAGDSGWINDELLAWSTNSMDDLASHIASLAKLRSDELTADDITVAAIKVLRI